MEKIEIIEKNPKVVGITAAMPDGTGLDILKEKIPQNYYDVGIAEQHAVTFAAGLAAQGIPLEAAARIGVCLHARAADLAAERGERGLLATDVMAPLRGLVNPD